MKENRVNTKTIVFTAMMGAISTVLMALNFSVPFAPSFMKFDIAELPALFAGFFLGPGCGCGVVLIKILLKLVTQGTETAFVGEAMNLVGSICFVLPASLIYKRLHTKKGAIISLVVSSILVSIVYVLLNAFVAFPMYAALYGIPMDALVGMGTAIYSGIKDLPTMMLYSVLPFNLFKYAVTSLVTYLIYKRAGATLRNMLQPEYKTKRA